MKMTFISNNWADAHQQTRLKALIKSGIYVDCVAVSRNYYPISSEIEPHRIGKVDHASYTKRLRTYILLLYKLIKNFKSNQLIYVYGFDLALVVLIFKMVSRRKTGVIYEVPDIREILFSPDIRGKLIRYIEKLTIPKIDLIIATSPEFISEYFVKMRKISIPDFRIIENKIHKDQLPGDSKCQPQIVSTKIKIGYFGVLRCTASLNCLILLADKNQFEIILHGIFMPATSDFEKRISNLENIRYLGPYRVPEDLSKIYNEVDIVWASYPFSQNKFGNHLWARTNRFYESLFFHKPVILQKETADAKRAKTFGNIAIEIDLKDIHQVVSQLCSLINSDYLSSARKLLDNIPEHHYLITTEYENLSTCLKEKT